MRHPRAGISLFEITVVMLILGIVAAVAAPRFSDSFQASQLVATANQIAGHVDYIRRAAVNEGRTTTLHVNSSTDRYYSGEVTFPELVGVLIDVDVKAVHHPTFELSADFDGLSSLSFDLEGVPHAGGTPMQNGKISITYAGNTMHINIAAGTGDTTVTVPPAAPETDNGYEDAGGYGDYGGGY